MLVNFKFLMKTISLCLLRMFFLTELQDLGHATRTGLQVQNRGRP